MQTNKDIKIKPRYENVIICCQVLKSGGPEALHQLAVAISDLGGKVSVIYFLDETRYDITKDKFVSINPPKIPGSLYDQYPVNQVTEFALTESTLLILSESYTFLATQIPTVTKAIWWLSVDYSFLSKLQLLPKNYAADFFAQKQIQHFYQSQYANHTLQSYDAKQRFALSDYVNIDFDPSTYAHSRNTIAFYPLKGKELAQRFAQLHAGLQFVAIQNMSRSQVDQTLSRAGIYIDFGNHPGKDRVPREAAQAGAVVLLHRHGGAKFFEDHPLADEYFFTSTDVQNGNLYNKVKQILSNRLLHFDRQAQYRTTIALEKQKFYLEVTNIFFESCQ
jgi:hypothetical protein